MSDATSTRVFKTAWFAKASRKARISDVALCNAIAQVIAGRADDLGGGVYKKRLADNQLRSIILARGGEYWVYQYLFAKQDRPNIEEDELKALELGQALWEDDQGTGRRASCRWSLDRDLYRTCGVKS